MNSINIPTGEDILRQNGIVSLQDYRQDPASLDSLNEIIRLARKKLEQQRRMKTALDIIVKEVLESQ